MALVYPHRYPLATCNLGYQLVYTLLNDIDEVVCERFVYPETGTAFRSLESRRPLVDFPLVLGSISFEQDYPRMAALLAAGGIAPLALDRGEVIGPGVPLVVLGGVAVSMNPEPLAPFADLMVIGEAEGMLVALVREILAQWRQQRRRNLLSGLAARFPGCYVPVGYHFVFDRQHLVAIQGDPALPRRVRRIQAPPPEEAGHSTLLSPQAELSMYMVELGRGCSRGCRFCAAGYIYRPPRLWSADTVIKALGSRPAAMKRVGLVGMEMATADTLARIADYLLEKGCQLSFSSLRADRIGPQILRLLRASQVKSAAIAPDGASERLRQVINKGLGRQELLVAGEELARAGIVHLKLYVMIGLPTETEADLAELVTLVADLQQRLLKVGRPRGRVAEVLLSVNVFVPKPWTPFQYCGIGGLLPLEGAPDFSETESMLALKRKIKYIRKNLGVFPNLSLRIERPERVLEQVVFARGDRRLAPVLLDMGLERRSFRAAMRHHGLESWWYSRPRGAGEMLPWQVVDHGMDPHFLWHELEKAVAGRLTAPCEVDRCRRCGVCDGSASSATN